MFVELRFRQPETWIKDIKLKQRIISALIAIPLFLAIILFAPQPVYLAFWHLCIIACSYEFFKIRGLSKINSLISSVIIGSVAPIFFYILFSTEIDSPTGRLIDFIASHTFFIMSIIALLSWCIIIPIFFKKYNKNQQFKINNILLFCMWFFIISTFFAFTALFGEDLYDTINSAARYMLLSILVIIWANDAGAYFVGKAIGKHKFSPIISPNKTWEGFFGGIIVATLALVIIYLFAPALDKKVLIIAPIISIFATIGDLFQSMLKRMAGVKDSGNIMPGHGGVFDRIDSWLSVGCILLALGMFGLARMIY